MSIAYTTYIVNQNDTLEAIAQRQLGDWTRWKEIAGLNSLRYPFISDKPERWYGAEIATGTLINDVGLQANAIHLPGERRDLILPGSVFFLDGYIPNNAGNNAYAYDAVAIQSYDDTQGVLVLQTVGPQINHNWAQGTRWRIFPPPANMTSRVIRPGDRIFLPIASADAGSILATTSTTELYGTDIALSRRGKVSLTNGDLTTVSGVDNIGQALRFRCELPYGSYIVHTDEGNKCYFLIGEPVRPETPLRSTAFIKEALETDPRVLAVTEAFTDIPQPDEVHVNATVQLARSEDQITVNTLLRSRQ